MIIIYTLGNDVFFYRTKMIIISKFQVQNVTF